MTQIHVLHARSGTQFAEAGVRGLDREGYATFWDAENGPLSSRGLELAERAVCIVFWTRDAVYSKWLLESAQKAHVRDALVEVTLDPIQSPIEGSDLEPLDFSDWDGKPAGPLWAALMTRVRAAAGRPTGKLPLKEEAPPALWMAGLTFVAVTTLAVGGLPDTRAPSDSLALAPASLAPGAIEAVGGPQAGVREPASAALVQSGPSQPPVTAHFDMMEPTPAVQIVPLKDFDASEAKTDLASAAGPEAPASEAPNT